jgi:hypothetical protein
MNAFNNWALEHVENIENAVEEGATDLEEIVQYCLTNMDMVDIPYVEEYLEENWDGYGCKDWNREAPQESPIPVDQRSINATMRSINATIKARRLIFGADD